ncbi:hypothetical protein ACEPAG_8870 [Sanghuangporus baumii]
MQSKLLTVARSLPRRLLRYRRKRKSAQQSHSVWDHLPAELWHSIFSFLGRSELAALSSTCSFLRTLATPELFSSLRLRVGRYTVFHLDDNEEGHAKLVKRSIPVLRRLTRPGTLVGGQYVLNDLVRSLHIVAGMHLENKEKQILLLTLRRLPNLLSFDWMGSKLPEDVAAAVASRIETLRVASIGNPALHELCALQGGLHTIELIDARLSSWKLIGPYARDMFEEKYGTNPVQGLLEHNSATLQKLSVFAPDLRQNNTKLFDSFLKLNDNIVHLAINNTGDLPGFDQFLRHSSSLQSLTILDATSLSFLPCNSKSSLPNLKDLKLGINTCPSNTVGPDMQELSQTLFAFLRDHLDLRRFDFALWPFIDPTGEEPLEENRIWFSIIIEAVCSLRKAYAIGISFPSLTSNTIQDSLNNLSECAQSLEICTALRLEGISNASIDAVVAKLHRCTFIALSSIRHSGTFRWLPGTPAINVEDLVQYHGLRHLDQALLYDRMYDIYPSGSLATDDIVLQPWNIERVRWRTEADFYNLDAYWLISYRFIRNIDVFLHPPLPVQN